MPPGVEPVEKFSFRSWNGPYYGFEHARISVGHTYRPNAYSMHYGLFLHDRGIPVAAPYFMTFAEAEELLGNVGVPGPPTTREPDHRPMTWQLPEDCHSSSWVADEVISYLRTHAARQSGDPFYIAANFPDPHPPFAVPAPWDEMYEGVGLPPPARRLGEWEGKAELYRATMEGRLAEMGFRDRWRPSNQTPLLTPTNERTELEERWWRTYMGMQSLVDKHLDRILDELDALGLAESTLVIATSDHGDSMGDHFLWQKGGSHYDGTIRVPLIVRWPGHVPAGARSNSIQSLVDLPTTIMAAAGLEPDRRMQGIDQLPSWRDPAVSCREGTLIEHRIESGYHVNTWVTDRHRLSIYADLNNSRTELELYDLQEDPQELEPLPATGRARHEAVDELLADAWREAAAVQSPWLERETLN